MKIREAGPEDVADIARIHVEGWQLAYRGMLPEAYLNSLKYEDGVSRWKQFFGDKSKFAYLAVDDAGVPVGFASGGRERTGDPDYDGEVYAIYISQNHQRKGIGRSLIDAVKRRLARQGIGSMLLWCLKDNPARRFYEAIGGKQVRQREIDIGGLTLRETGYGWISLKSN